MGGLGQDSRRNTRGRPAPRNEPRSLGTPPMSPIGEPRKQSIAISLVRPMGKNPIALPSGFMRVEQRVRQD
jgi:hypothetical protein